MILATLPVWRSVAGGALIGAGVAVLILFDGFRAGISGIFGRVLRWDLGQQYWRIAFLAGLLLPALIVGPGTIIWQAPWWLLGVAGLLVGIGTYVGSGCTSGHGVCGISNLSLRSLTATATFMLVAMATVAAVRWGSHT